MNDDRAAIMLGMVLLTIPAFLTGFLTAALFL